VIREVQHDVLKFEVSMHDEDVHHIAKALDQLLHDDLYDVWSEFPVFEFHEFLKVVAIAEFH
jgi:hypothetical protein